MKARELLEVLEAAIESGAIGPEDEVYWGHYGGLIDKRTHYGGRISDHPIRGLDISAASVGIAVLR